MAQFATEAGKSYFFRLGGAGRIVKTEYVLRVVPESMASQELRQMRLMSPKVFE
ncbi:MAG: hypothetical protein H7256_06030 [Bdellovibrio sp.]|nr:hypothetical protein [Bdellovibrio sp.]